MIHIPGCFARRYAISILARRTTINKFAGTCKMMWCSLRLAAASSAHARSKFRYSLVQIRPPQPRILLFQQLPNSLQPSEFVVLVTDSKIWMVEEHRNTGRFVTVLRRRNSFFSGAIGSEAWNARIKTGARMGSVLPGPAHE